MYYMIFLAVSCGRMFACNIVTTTVLSGLRSSAVIYLNEILENMTQHHSEPWLFVARLIFE